MKGKARLKAVELIEKFEHETNSLVKDELAKKYALIAVDLIKNTFQLFPFTVYEAMSDQLEIEDTEEFWIEVINQINIL